MNPIVIFLVGIAGALIGTITGILLLRGKLRPPITETEVADLRGKLQAGQTSLAAASASEKELLAQLASKEASLLQCQTDLAKRQERLDAESAEMQKERAQRAVAEQRALELSAEVVVLTEQCTKLESQARQERDRAGEIGSRLVAAEGELDGGKKKIQELTEQTASLIAESIELNHLREQEGRIRADREAQLDAERDTVRRLTDQINELQGERAQLEVKLRTEMGSTAKGIELLMVAQEKLSSAFKVLGLEEQNGNGCRTKDSLAEAVGRIEATLEAEEVAAASSSHAG